MARKRDSPEAIARLFDPVKQTDADRRGGVAGQDGSATATFILGSQARRRFAVSFASKRCISVNRARASRLITVPNGIDFASATSL
jgi:hypothetical protein